MKNSDYSKYGIIISTNNSDKSNDKECQEDIKLDYK